MTNGNDAKNVFQRCLPISDKFLSRYRQKMTNHLVTPLLTLTVEPSLPSLLEKNITMTLHHLKVYDS